MQSYFYIYRKYCFKQENRVVSLRDPKRTVDQFCQWASTKTYRTSYYDTGVNHDVAVLLTRNKFAPAGRHAIICSHGPFLLFEWDQPA